MFWDRVAGIYDFFAYVINRKTHKALCEKIQMLVSKEDQVLECACGTGLLTFPIASVCKSLIATDFSANMVKRAKQKGKAYSNIQFAIGDIMHLDYPDQHFDKVIAGNVIHLLEDPLSALTELNRLCKKNGHIIIPTYMNKKKSGQVEGFVKAVGKAGAGFKQQFTYDSYQAFFKEAGYETIDFFLIEGKIPCAVAVLKKKQ